MSFLRFLMVVALAVWVGGLTFFPFVAQTSFSVLPSPSQAGSVVGHLLIILHRIGMASAIVFLIGSMMYSRFSNEGFRWVSARNILVLLMLGLTLISQLAVIPRMNVLRTSVPGGITYAAPAIRAQFDMLHVWSTRIEGLILLLGLAVLFVVATSWREHA